MNINSVLSKAKQALEGCVEQMSQAKDMFKDDMEWQRAIDDAEIAIDELSMAMEREYYTLAQLDAALEISNFASTHGYRATNGRDSRAQYLNWAVEFESMAKDPADRLSAVMEFTEQKMLAEIEAGRGRLRETKLSSWAIDSFNKKPRLEFDPTTPENYLQVIQDPVLVKKYENEINDAFESHMLAVGDKLTEKGWRGTAVAFLSENQVAISHESRLMSAYFKPMRVEGTANVIGGTWNIMQKNEKDGIWENVHSITDGLNRTPEYIADQIQKFKDKELNKVSAKNLETYIESAKVRVVLADENFSETVNGKIIGRMGMHVIQNGGDYVVIHATNNLSRIPDLNEVVTIACKNGKGVVSDREQDKGQQR